MTTNQKRINKNSNNNQDNSHKSMLTARENAGNAKENAMATMSQTSKESQAVYKPDETLAKILDEAEQRIQKHTISEHHDIPLQAPLTDIFPEIKRKTISPEVTRNQQLEQLLNDLTEEKAQKKIEENNEEARTYNIEVQKALDEVNKIKKAAENAVRQAQEEAQTSLTRINQSLFQARRHVAGMAREDACKIRQAVQGTRQPLNTSAEESTEPLPEKGVNARIAEVKEQQLLDKIMEMHHPLHSISGFTRMILDDNICDTAAQKEFLAMILQQSENLKLQLDNMYCLLKASPE